MTVSKRAGLEHEQDSGLPTLQVAGDGGRALSPHLGVKGTFSPELSSSYSKGLEAWEREEKRVLAGASSDRGTSPHWDPKAWAP